MFLYLEYLLTWEPLWFLLRTISSYIVRGEKHILILRHGDCVPPLLHTQIQHFPRFGTVSLLVCVDKPLKRQMIPAGQKKTLRSRETVLWLRLGRWIDCLAKCKHSPCFHFLLTPENEYSHTTENP